MHLQHAERRRLVEDAAPTGGVELRAPARAPAGSSNRGIAAGSDGCSSARRASGASSSGIGRRPPCRRDPGACRGHRSRRFRRRIVFGRQRLCDGPDRGDAIAALSTATAMSSGIRTRSGAWMIHCLRASLNCKRTFGLRRGIAAPSSARWAAGASAHAATPRRAGRRRRDQAGGDIGVIERVELRPQHIAFELERRPAPAAALGGPRLALDVVEREIGVARRLGRRALK